MKNKEFCLVYDYHQDASHGWLQVPKEEIIRLGLVDKISEYSYVDARSVYLEEDADATLFERTLKEKIGEEEFNKMLVFERMAKTDHSFVRNRERYNSRYLKGY